MIYLVEDDASIRELVVYALNNSGFQAVGFDTPSAFWQALAKQTPELILLDIMLPEEDGLQMLRRLRQSPVTRRTPVIMLTAKGSEYDKVIGLEAGADDYIPKPFGMMEMVSRIRAVLRRTAPVQETPDLTMGELSLSASEHTVRLNGQRIDLTLKEYELLHLFLSAPGQVFSREQLLDRVWDTDYFGGTRTVDVHIGTLRTKLGPCGNYIRTVRGVGYRMEMNA